MICFHEIFAKDHKSKEKRDLNNLAFSRIFWRMEKKGKIKYKWVFNIVNTFTNFCIGGGKKEFENEKITVIVRFHEIFALWKKEEYIQVLTYFDETFAVFSRKRNITLHFFNFLGSIGRRIAVPLQSEKRCIKVQPYEMLFWSQKGQPHKNSWSWNYPCHSI